MTLFGLDHLFFQQNNFSIPTETTIYQRLHLAFAKRFFYVYLIYKQQSNRPLKPKLQKSITATSDTLLLREFKFIQSIIIGSKLMCINNTTDGIHCS